MKDTTNKVEHNVWSCGEYNKNTNTFSTTGEIQTTKEYSLIGENSLKIINHTSGTINATTNETTCDTGNTYTLTCTLYNPNTQVNVVLLSNQNTFSVVAANPSDKPQEISVSYTTVTGDINLRARWNVFSNNCFVDNIRLIKN